MSNRTHGTQSRWKTQQNIVVDTHDNLNIGSSSRFFYLLPHSASSLFKLLRHVESPIQVIHALLGTRNPKPSAWLTVSNENEAQRSEGVAFN